MLAHVPVKLCIQQPWTTHIAYALGTSGCVYSDNEQANSVELSCPGACMQHFPFINWQREKRMLLAALRS